MAADIDLLVLGDANPDLILHGGDVVPAFGQAEHLVDDARLTMGGSGAILACGAAKLGLRVAICALIGDDLFGRFVREGLDAAGVDTTGLSTDEAVATGVTVVLSGPQDRAIITMPGTIAGLRAELISPALLERARHVHVSSYYLQTALVSSLPGIFDGVHDQRRNDLDRSELGSRRDGGTAICSSCCARPMSSCRTRWRRRVWAEPPIWRTRCARSGRGPASWWSRTETAARSRAAPARFIT